jgi:hypothetical protein
VKTWRVLQFYIKVAYFVANRRQSRLQSKLCNDMTELAKSIICLPFKPLHYIIQCVLNLDNPISESIRDFIHPNRKHRFKFVVTCLARVLGADVRKKRSLRAQVRRVATPEVRAIKRERRLAAQEISPEKLHSLQDELASLRAELGNLSLLSSMCSESPQVAQIKVKPAAAAAPPPPPPPPPPTPPPLGFNLPPNQQALTLSSKPQQQGAQAMMSPPSSSDLMSELKSR